jgi:hypothetical protein
MQKLITLLVFAVLALSMAGCHLVYTPDVQQGNLLDKEVVGQLKPGMTKRQVLVLMGARRSTPAAGITCPPSSIAVARSSCVPSR